MLILIMTDRQGPQRCFKYIKTRFGGSPCREGTSACRSQTIQKQASMKHEALVALGVGSSPSFNRIFPVIIGKCRQNQLMKEVVLIVVGSFIMVDGHILRETLTEVF